MKNTIRIFWGLEFLLALLLIAGVLPENSAYIFLLVLMAGIWKLSDLDALRLYIFSIPIFVALPSNFLAEAMSAWRIALLFFALKIFLKKFKVLETLGNRGLVFADKKSELLSRFGDFIEDIKTSNYRGIFYPMFAFALAGFLSLIFAQSLGAGIKKMIFLASVLLLFSIVTFVARTKQDVMSVMKSVFLSGIFILLVGYLQLASTFFVFLYDFWGLWDNYVIRAFYGERMMILLSYSNTWFSYYDATGDIPPTLRMFSVMTDSHSFSMLMILFTPLALFYFYAANKKQEKRRYFLVVALMLLAIFFSGSRGAWVGWAGALAAALYFYLSDKLPKKLKIPCVKDYQSNRRIYKTVLGSVFLFVVLIPVASFVLGANQDSQLIREGKVISGDRKNALMQRTLSISDMDETSNKGRMEIWKDSFASIVKHPVCGIGLGNFPLALSEKISTSKMGASAHNIYLNVAVETGLVGLAIFLWLLWRICLKLCHLSQKFREEKFRLLAFSFLVYLIWIFAYGFFDVVIENDKVLMFFIIILAVLYKLEDLEEMEILEEKQPKNAQ